MLSCPIKVYSEVQSSKQVKDSLTKLKMLRGKGKIKAVSLKGGVQKNKSSSNTIELTLLIIA